MVDQEAFNHEISGGQEIYGTGNLAEVYRVYSMSKNSLAISCLLSSLAAQQMQSYARGRDKGCFVDKMTGNFGKPLEHDLA